MSLGQPGPPICPLLCQLVPFVEVVLLTAMEYQEDIEEKTEKEIEVLPLPSDEEGGNED